MSQVLTKPILLNETGQAINETLNSDLYLGYTDIESQLDTNIKDMAKSLSDIRDTMILSGRTPLKISIVTPPAKIMYKRGDALDLTGIVVCATMTDGTDSVLYDITEKCTYTPTNGTTLDGSVQTITASWTWEASGSAQTFTATTPIHVNVVEIVSWEDGSDEEIVAMLQAHYDPTIDFDVTDYWNVGAVRKINVENTTIPSDLVWSGTKEITTHEENWVLMNVGGKKLANGVTDCAFIVGMQDILTSAGNSTNSSNIYFYWNTSSDSSGNYRTAPSWYDCSLKHWLDSDFRNAIPSSIRGIFKQFRNVSCGDDGLGQQTSTDYFAVPSEQEVLGTTTKSQDLGQTQWEWYQTDANTLKYAPKDRTRSQSYGSRDIWYDATATPDSEPWLSFTDASERQSLHRKIHGADNGNCSNMSFFGVI